MQREIIRIDEELCNGCGACVTGCAEGALEIVDGKARLVRDMYCDGLGACLGHCPTGALTIITRDAEDFDEEAAMARVRALEAAKESRKPLGCGCPGSAMMYLRPKAGAASGPRPGMLTQPDPDAPSGGCSGLGHWPVKIRLVPPNAPFLKGAHLVVAADCAAVALPGFHADWVPDKVILMGCPKFDVDADYAGRFAELFATADVASVTVLRMEVPCCGGLPAMVAEGIRRSGKDIPFTIHTVTRRGQVADKGQ